MNTRTAWGRRPMPAPAWARRVHDRHAALPVAPDSGHWLPQGRQRSYGDVCLNPGGGELSSLGLERVIHFDRSTGVCRAEAGLSLGDLMQLVAPHGWAVPVLPGTRYVTLGGAVANDVHGKNHEQRGSFGEHVLSLELVRSDGVRQVCSPVDQPGLFRASIAGLGLTGFITWVEIQLCRADGGLIECEEHAFGSLAEYVQLDHSVRADWEFRVAWLDGTRPGRGILSLGRFAPGIPVAQRGPSEPISLPIVPPFNLVQPWVIAGFNAVYARKQRRSSPALVAPQRYFFPLDGMAGWNRLYGPRGFFQYQCVLCGAEQAAVGTEILQRIRASGHAAGLIVAKQFGRRLSPGLLSFARAGLTLAIDLPDRGAATLALLDELDHCVRQCAGALYPAKDARMSATMFEQAFPSLGEFRVWKDPGLSSAFWRRVTTTDA